MWQETTPNPLVDSRDTSYHYLLFSVSKRNYSIFGHIYCEIILYMDTYIGSPHLLTTCNRAISRPRIAFGDWITYKRPINSNCSIVNTSAHCALWLGTYDVHVKCKISLYSMVLLIIFLIFS